MSLLNLNIEEKEYLKLIEFNITDDEEIEEFYLKKRKYENALFDYLIQGGKISPKVLDIGIPIDDELRLLLMNKYIENCIQFKHKKSLIEFHYRIMIYIINFYFDYYVKLCNIILLKIKENQEKIDLEDIREIYYDFFETLNIYEHMAKDPVELYDLLTTNKDLREKYFALKFKIDNTFNKNIKEKTEKFSSLIYYMNSLDEKEFEFDEHKIKKIDDFNKGKYNHFLKTYNLTRITSFTQFSSEIKNILSEWIHKIKSVYKDDSCYNDTKYEMSNYGSIKYSFTLTYKELQQVCYLEFFSAIMYNKFHKKHLYIYLENQLKFNDEFVNFFIEIINRFQKKRNYMSLITDLPDDYLDIFNNLVGETINHDDKNVIIWGEEKIIDEDEIKVDDKNKEHYDEIVKLLKPYIERGTPENYSDIVNEKSFSNKKKYLIINRTLKKDCVLFAKVFNLTKDSLVAILKQKDGKNCKEIELTNQYFNSIEINLANPTEYEKALIKVRNECLNKINPSVFPILERKHKEKL